MKRFATFAWRRSADRTYGEIAQSATGRANRRRLIVFLSVFCISGASGIAYDFLRPPEYRATSRLQITPASYVAPGEVPAVTGRDIPSDAARPFLTEVQKLTSRPLLEEVASRLAKTGQDISSLGRDPVKALQSSLTVTPVAGTHVAELAATGPHPELPAALLVLISEVYRTELARSFDEHSKEATARADEEVQRLNAAVAAKRSSVEAFRVRNSIVSPERDENEALAQLQGLGKSLQAADDRVSAAEGKVSALRAAVAAGKGAVRAKDDPTLANLEQRASQVREDLRDLERSYTPDYLALDPDARALRARLAELERQIEAQRATSKQSALAEAEEELAGAREARRRLREQIAAGRRSAGQFSARFEQYKELRSELAQIESSYRDALQRKATLEATERARVPSVQILEQAVLPLEPWRPKYWRDAGFVVLGSLLLGLLAMAIVELFNRPEPRPAILLAQPVISGAVLQGVEYPPALASTPAPLLHEAERPLLARPAMLPRELTVQETHSLMRAADRDARVAISLLLSGISPEEALDLRWRDVDPERGVATIVRDYARTVRLNAVAAQYLAAESRLRDAPVLRGPAGQPATLDSVSTQLVNAAHDAGLERVHEVTPHALRHTYIAFLVRQGVRFADLAQLVGQLPAATLAAYSALAPAGARLAPDAVNYVFPGLEHLETG